MMDLHHFPTSNLKKPLEKFQISISYWQIQPGRDSLTVEAQRFVIARRRVGGAPHERWSTRPAGHVPLRTRGQAAAGEASHGVGPGCGGTVDGAAVDPGSDQVHLHRLHQTFSLFHSHFT